MDYEYSQALATWAALALASSEGSTDQATRLYMMGTMYEAIGD